MKYFAFLKWWLFFTLTIVGTIFSYYSGMLGLIWEKDASYLSFVTILVFYVTSLICGTNIYRLCRVTNPSKDTLQSFEKHEDIGWFISEVCLNLGMLGTIIGFCMMLAGFDVLDISKQQTVQGLLTELGKSMATALYTTLVGLICGQLLKIQYFLLNLAIKDKEKPIVATELVGMTTPSGVQP